MLDIKNISYKKFSELASGTLSNISSDANIHCFTNNNNYKISYLDIYKQIYKNTSQYTDGKFENDIDELSKALSKALSDDYTTKINNISNDYDVTQISIIRSAIGVNENSNRHLSDLSGTNSLYDRLCSISSGLCNAISNLNGNSEQSNNSLTNDIFYLSCCILSVKEEQVDNKKLYRFFGTNNLSTLCDNIIKPLSQITQYTASSINVDSAQIILKNSGEKIQLQENNINNIVKYNNDYYKVVVKSSAVKTVKLEKLIIIDVKKDDFDPNASSVSAIIGLSSYVNNISINLSNSIYEISNCNISLLNLSTNLSTDIKTLSTSLSTDIQTISTNLSNNIKTLSTNLSDNIKLSVNNLLANITTINGSTENYDSIINEITNYLSGEDDDSIVNKLDNIYNLQAAENSYGMIKIGYIPSNNNEFKVNCDDNGNAYVKVTFPSGTDYSSKIDNVISGDENSISWLSNKILSIENNSLLASANTYLYNITTENYSNLYYYSSSDKKLLLISTYLYLISVDSINKNSYIKNGVSNEFTKFNTLSDVFYCKRKYYCVEKISNEYCAAEIPILTLTDIYSNQDINDDTVKIASGLSITVNNLSAKVDNIIDYTSKPNTLREIILSDITFTSKSQEFEIPVLPDELSNYQIIRPVSVAVSAVQNDIDVTIEVNKHMFTYANDVFITLSIASDVNQITDQTTNLTAIEPLSAKLSIDVLYAKIMK